MNLPKLFAILAITFAFAPSAHANPATAEAVVVTSIAQYNEIQRRRAFVTDMLLESQGDKNYCVFFQARSALHALGHPPIEAEEFRKKLGKIEWANFGDGLASSGIEAIYYTGGAVGAFVQAKRTLTTGELRWDGTGDALDSIVAGVNDGRIVLVSLHSGPIHKDVAAQRNFKGKVPSGAHAIRVLGFHKRQDGSIDQAYVYDTAAPVGPLRYAIDFENLKRAYSTITTRGSRGVYITEERAFPPLEEKY